MIIDFLEAFKQEITKFLTFWKYFCQYAYLPIGNEILVSSVNVK